MRQTLRLLCFLFLSAAGLQHRAAAQIPEQYPKPLLHTPDNHPAQHVLIIVVDGLSAEHLADFVRTHRTSALAALSARGVTYTNAHMPWPDPAAALMTLVSGGSPVSTGIFSSRGYDRALLRQGCTETSAPLNFTAGSANIVAGGDGCGPVVAHDLVRVNSIFDLVHRAGGGTAWAGTSAAYADMLRGPTGKALDNVFVASAAPAGVDAYRAAEMQDHAAVDAVIDWIARGAQAPQMTGVALTELAAEQDTESMERTLRPDDARSTTALAAIDAEIEKMIAALKIAGTYDETWIVVTARFGTRGDRADLRVVDSGSVEKIAFDAAAGGVYRVVAGTAALIWLKDSRDAPAVMAEYQRRMTELGIGEIYGADKLQLVMNTAENDSRMPDIVLGPMSGVQWSMHRAWPQRLGGFSDSQNHVAMLISGRQLTGREDKTPVPAGQLAPLMVRMLGMEKFGLDALHEEHVPALPGIF